MAQEPEPVKTAPLWETEEDIKTFSASGFPCLIRRTEVFLTLCGYVALPEKHPLHGWDLVWEPPEDTPHVHRGWTWSGDTPPTGIEGKDDAWYIGFDCCHVYDFVPGMHVGDTKLHSLINRSGMNLVYRDMAYVENELRRACLALSQMQVLLPKD